MALFLCLPSQIFHEMMEKEQVRRPSEPNGLLEAVRVTERGEEGRTPSSFLLLYPPFSSSTLPSPPLTSPPLPSLLLSFLLLYPPFSSSPLTSPLLSPPLPSLLLSFLLLYPPFSSSTLPFPLLSPPLPSLLLLSSHFSSSPFSSSPLPLPLLLSPLPPSVVTQAQNHPTVKEQIKSHIPVLQDFILQILQRLRGTIRDVPYGIRWLCKAIRALVQEKFPDVTVERMNSLIGGFFLLRYLNPIIVTPHSKSVCPF